MIYLLQKCPLGLIININLMLIYEFLLGNLEETVIFKA